MLYAAQASREYKYKYVGSDHDPPHHQGDGDRQQEKGHNQQVEQAQPERAGPELQGAATYQSNQVGERQQLRHSLRPVGQVLQRDEELPGHSKGTLIFKCPL